jgi:biotin operon repressor BirA-like protein
MADTGARTLRLLSLLQQRPFWSGDELADRLEVSARTVRRDVERLRALGYPVSARVGVAGGYELAPGASLPPLVLDDDEALALVVGLHAVVNGAVAGVAEPSIAALGKVMAVMPPRLRRRVEAFHAVTVPSEPSHARAAVDLETLAAIALACRNQERVTFGYVDRDGATSERRVEPHRIVLVGDRWYLVAFDNERTDWRMFRIDRLRDLTEVGRRFHPREIPGRDAAAFVAAGRTTWTARHEVDVVIEAPTAEVDARIGQWASVEPLGAHQCRAIIHAESLEWAAFALGTLGASFQVTGPDEFRAVLRDWAGRFAAGA